MNDIEFGGNDLLQVYNPQQIKHRLNSNGNVITEIILNFIFIYFLVSLKLKTFILYQIFNIHFVSYVIII